MPILSINKLEYAWPGAEAPILDVPEFQVGQGESVFLQGASGSGKSTLLSLIAGTLTARQGVVEVLGTNMASLSARKRDRFRAEHIGIVFQQFNLIPFLTVAGNLRLATRFASASRNYTEAQALSILESLRLDASIAQRRADRLSVGQQQRVAIARAVINEPELILADEPTSALDSDARDQFMRLLMSIREKTGCSLIFASHDAALADYFETRLSLSEINRATQSEAAHV